MTTSFEVITSILRSYHPLVILRQLTDNLRDPSLSEQERGRHGSLLSFVSTLLPFARLDHAPSAQITSKEYRRLLMSHEELMRKSVRYVDNTALRLRSIGAIRGDNLMLAYQEEALAFLDGGTEMSIDEQYRALQYRLQPFNGLIGELFSAKLDGLLSAFRILAERTPTTLSTWEVASDTKLSEHDAHLLSVEMGSQGDGEERMLPIEAPAVASRPFSRLRATYYCFDGKRLLRDGYLVIKEAVCRTSDEMARRWQEIEQTKSRLLPITFCTAMFGTMDWQRDWPLGEGIVDALFERGEQRVLVQVPWADHAIEAINPIAESERAIESISAALAKERLVSESGERAIIVDCRDRISYPLKAVNDVLYLSFFQLASIGTSWEGVATIKEQLGLAPLAVPPMVEDVGKEEEDEELDLRSSGSSYFTTMFSDETLQSETDEEDEEGADEIFNFAEQPSLFDFDDENLFSYDRDGDEDDEYEYESEAYNLIETQEIGDEMRIDDWDLSMADEEMESGSPDHDVTYYGPGEDEDDEDELLELIKEPEAPPRDFTLADAVSRASHAPSAERRMDEEGPAEEAQADPVIEPLLHPTIARIVARLPVIEGSVFASFVHSGDTALLMQTATLIDEARRAQALDKRDKMFSVPGLDLTIVVAGDRGDAMTDWNRRNSVGVLMYLQKKPHWSMLELHYDAQGALLSADERIISAKEFSTSDWKYVASLAERIVERKRTP